MRASELINIKLSDIDLDNCQIKITKGKGKKDRIVSFPKVFMEVLAVHMDGAKKKKATYLFESVRKKPYSDREIRKIMQKYTEKLVLSTLYLHINYAIFIYLAKKKRCG